MQPDNWNDYQVFLAIAREGQHVRAAKRLGIDATTVGRRLRRLEGRLGQNLFEQTSGGQVLTEAGEALLSKVEAMAEAASLIEMPDDWESGPVGTLRISVSEGFGTWFLAPKLPDFTAKFPGITVDLVASSSYLNLSRREADVAIFLSRPRVGLLIAKKLSEYRLGLYGSNEYLKTATPPLTRADLTGHRLVGYIPDLLTAPELRYAEEVHRDARTSLRSTSINAQLAMVLGGGGLGVLPRFIGDNLPGLTRVLPKHHLVRQLWLVTHKDTYKLAKVRAFGNWMHEILRSGGAQELQGTL